jgi:TRAP transporter TAXI family solute receptor
MSGLRDFLKVYWPLVVVAFAGVLLALVLMDPAPPKTIRFAAGSPGGAYHAFAERYQRLLAEEGVEVVLVETQGSIDNLRLLDDSEVDVGLVQGGLSTVSDEEELRSIGGLFPEPFWVFVRNDVPADTLGDLHSVRMAVGGDGSGTRMLALELEADYGGEWDELSRLPLSGNAAADALLAGNVDAVAFSASVEASYVDRLLNSPDVVRLLAFDRAPALARRHEALSDIVLLRGVVDIGKNLPATDIPLVAPVAQLVVRKDLHPAIEALLIDAATAIHSQGTLLAPAGEYPDPDLIDLPISEQARRYYKDGPSFLRRYFSFDVANFLDRAWVLAIPLLTLLFPLVRVAPPIYRWRVRRKIYVWYEDLRALEERGRSTDNQTERDKVQEELETLQAEIGAVEVPLSYTDDLYRLRSHVEFVKQLVRERNPVKVAG